MATKETPSPNAFAQDEVEFGSFESGKSNEIYYDKKHIRSLENIRRARTCFRWTFRYLLKTIALPKTTCNRETSVWFHQPFNSFTRKIVLRRHHRLDWSIYLQLHSLGIANNNIFSHLSRVKIYQGNNQRMHKYIRDEKLNCPRAYLPGAVLGWKYITC